jgi:hypothetical protein
VFASGAVSPAVVASAVAGLVGDTVGNVVGDIVAIAAGAELLAQAEAKSIRSRVAAIKKARRRNISISSIRH